jgi:hypothetical protein
MKNGEQNLIVCDLGFLRSQTQEARTPVGVRQYYIVFYGVYTWSLDIVDMLVIAAAIIA